MSELVSHLLLVENKSVAIDSSKSISSLVAHYLSNQVELRVIKLIRDGRGVVYSNLFKGSSNIEIATKKWVTYLNKIDFALKQLPGIHVLTVKYENLCQHRDETLNDIASFIGMNPFTLSGNNRNLENYHAIPGNFGLRAKSLKVELNEKWKTGLSDNDLLEFNKFSNGWNKRLGYQ